jgi:DME family drug/metabolite transporter
VFRSLELRSATSRSRSALIKISSAGLIWGSTGVVVQDLYRSTALSAVGIGFYRLAIAAVALLVVRRPRVVIAAVRVAPFGLLLTGIGLGAYQALYFVAVTLGGVSVATVLSLGLAPVLLAVAETVRARRLPDRTTAAMLLAGVIGLLLITGSTGRPSAGAPRPLIGLLAAVGCAGCYALSTVAGRGQAQRLDALTLTSATTAIGALTLAPVALIGGAVSGGPAGLGLPLHPGPLLLLGYLGIITTAVAYGLFYAGLRTTPGSTAAILTLLEPLVAALLAVLLLGEILPGPAVAGGMLLLVAIAVPYGRGTAPEFPGQRSTDRRREAGRKGPVRLRDSI